jgi:hypothetical protein
MKEKRPSELEDGGKRPSKIAERAFVCAVAVVKWQKGL